MNWRAIVGGWYNFATPSGAVWLGLTRALSIRGCFGAMAAAVSGNSADPNDGEQHAQLDRGQMAGTGNDFR